ncbi:palmitoyltransferase ZDHHC8B-like isoform X3 [Neoarius graeffei]|nr:palmitoyltransferase ZDHHC8B-like isoform X3 [Neoarius graeffei]
MACLILETLQSPEFMRRMYPDDQEDMLWQRIGYIVDLYLNTPDKGSNETPLHFACKFGCPEVVNVLCSHPDVDKNSRNKYGQMPLSIICQRNNKNKETKERIQGYLEDRFFVPLLRATDNTLNPVIGAAWAPGTSKYWDVSLSPGLIEDPKNPLMTIRAFVGPLNLSKAEEFHKLWKTPSRDRARYFHHILKSDPDRGAERVGRELAHEMGYPWAEYWDFLNCFTDLSTEDGLSVMEDYLNKQKNDPEKRFSDLRSPESLTACKKAPKIDTLLDDQLSPGTSVARDSWTEGNASASFSNRFPVCDLRNEFEKVALDLAPGAEDSADSGLGCLAASGLDGSSLEAWGRTEREEDDSGSEEYHTADEDTDAVCQTHSSGVPVTRARGILDHTSSCSCEDEDLSSSVSSCSSYKSTHSTPDHAEEFQPCVFLAGDSPSKLDSEVWFAVTGIDIDEQRFPCISRWRNVVGSYPESQRHRWPSVTVTNRHTTSQTSTPRRITHSWLTGSPSFLNMNKFIPASSNEDEDKDDDIRAPLYKDVEVRGIQFRMKWCSACNFYRPPRCSHCRVCDHCVEDFDHHCPWVNNCIGRRNYRFFFLFLLSLSVHMVAIFSGGLLYVLDHLETLWELRSTVTLSIMSMSGLFFIPVMGLACFHMVLVATGRTTNEQMNRKFQGGENPFTRGCCGNVEFVLCSPITPRYTRKMGNKQTVHIQPPFQIPESLKMSSIKVEDNGIQTEMLSVKRQSAGELDISGCKQLSTVPPLPPKPDPVLLKNHLATLQESLLQSKSAVLSVQSAIDQTVESSSRVHYQVPREQTECMTNPQRHISGFAQDPFFESGMEQTENHTPVSTHLVLQSSTLPMNALILNSHSLTLKHAHCRGNRTHQCPNSVPTSSAQGILSLSYDSLLSPAQRGTFKVNYLPSFLPLDPSLAIRCPAGAQHAPSRTCSPSFTGTSRQSPVHYDSLPKPAMSAIQERHELEELEKQPSFLPIEDMSVYDTPSGYSLPSRRPTPPAYGSREFLLSSAAYGYASSIRRASRTSSSSMHANMALQSCSVSPLACSSLEHHAQHSTLSIPCLMPSSSYTAQKALALITTSERKDSNP